VLPIVTLLVEVGTPLLQLPEVFQLLLLVPFQVSAAAHTEEEHATKNAAAKTTHHFPIRLAFIRPSPTWFWSNSKSVS
jgi:hypothetical protein